MKIKYKLKAAFMAAFSVLTLLITTLPASAAWDGLAGGATGNGGYTLTSTPFGILSRYDVFAWRVDMYVSANSDGKINKDIDIIGSDQLPLVGSLLCISENYGQESWPTYLQTNYTNESRSTFSSSGKLTTDNNGSIGLAEYALPTLYEFDPYAGIYYSYDTNNIKHPVAIAAKLPNKPGVNLFNGQYGPNTSFTTVATKLTTDTTYANDRTTEIIQQLLNKTSFKQDSFNSLSLQLKQNVLDIATSQNLNPVDNFDEIYNRYLLPTNPTDSAQSSPMVEWAMVITPLYRFECCAPFYCSSSSSVTTSNKGTKYVGGRDCVALDAYWFAQSNVTTKALGKGGMYAGLTYQSGSTTKQVWQNQSSGLLYFFLNKSLSDPSNSGAPAAAAYCTQPNDRFLGVYTNLINGFGVTSQQSWGGVLLSSPSEYAKRGGISVFTTEIQAPEAPVYYHTYTYTIDESNPPQGYSAGMSMKAMLPLVDKLGTPTISVSQGSSPTGNTYIPATDKSATDLGIPVAAMTPSPAITQPGKNESNGGAYPTSSQAAYYLQNYPESNPPTPLAATDVLNTGKATPNVTTDDPKEYHVKIIHIDVKQKPLPSQPSDGTDRIKTQDVTQFIEVTDKATKHLDSFSSLFNKAQSNAMQYNTANFSNRGASHIAPQNGIWITSIDSSAEDNEKVHATNYLNTEKSAHSSGGSFTYQVDGSHKDYCQEDCSNHHHTYNTWYCPAKKATCHWTKEYVDVYYGVEQPSTLQRTEDRNGKIIFKPYTPTFTKVGVTIPGAYYNYKDVVKLNKEYQQGTYDVVYTLPKKTTPECHNTKANAYATFDVLLNGDDNYWIHYLNGSKVIGEAEGIQHQSFDETNIKRDTESDTGGNKFDWLSSGKPMNSVQFIAHRDLLSGDEVSTSLAVSGYMAKYANNSSTINYLDFMKKAGFTFKGVEGTTIDSGNPTSLDMVNSEANKIGHENRVVWVANSATVSDLKSSKDGTGHTYNTNYVGGKGSTRPNNRQQVHFGLGGLADDGADIFARITNNNLDDITLNTTSHFGDATRPAYYFANISEGAKVHSTILITAAGTSEGPFTGLCPNNTGSHTCSYTTVTHNSNTHADVTKVTNNNYVAKNQDFYKNTMDRTHQWNKDTVTSHNGAIKKIEASRIAFEIPLAVEGTTAGQFNGANNEAGLIYKPTGSDGRYVEDYSLKLQDNVLTLVANDDTEESKTWTENTFRVRQSNYQHLGKATQVGTNVVAEYHFSTPTRDFTFNPSYYMLFDDDFEDTNRSVWMLSEQPRSVNFKDILSVRLTNNSSKSNIPEDKAYATHLSSEWSTDLADTKCHDKTNLPVAKAGNAIKANVEKSGGTITFYVVLQDPEFTANPGVTSSINSQIMQDYEDQAQKILSQFNTAAGSNGATMTTEQWRNKLSMAMFSNVTNLSSLNSGYRVTEQTGVALLNDKEPLKLTSDAKLTYEVTTGQKNSATTNASNWEFYALPGYKVTTMSTNCSEAPGTDISDTTSKGQREATLAGIIREVHSADSAPSHQKTTLNELNERLCMLMVPQNKAYSESLNCPAGTTPYLDGAGNFDWYAEDYEGFIVGVYEIEFTMSGKKSTWNSKTDGSIATEFSSIYRSESDWQAAFNELAAEDGHDLAVYTSRTFNGFNIDNFMDEGCTSKLPKQPKLSNNGEFHLLTTDGENTLAKWSKISMTNLNGKKYAEGIYGIGLELANLNISFGSSTAQGTHSNGVIGNTGKPFSFYYQPTYFNIRGSVYDTAR